MIETVLRRFPDYVLLFAACSVAGWCMEVALKFIQYRRFINRGYLIGPYCPIYGWGALLITLLAGGVIFPRCTALEAFLVGFFACGGLEYFVSWYLEKTSHARWWDYSGKPMNLNGRVWIGNLLLFGLAAVGIVYAVDPALFALFDRMPDRARWIAALIFMAILWTDRIISHALMRVIRNCIEHQDKDNTEEIRQEMHRMLRDRSLLLRRISQAYPELLPRPSRLMKQLEAARAEYRRASKSLAKRTIALRRADGKRRAASAALSDAVRKAKDAQKRAVEQLRAVERDHFNAR